MTAPVPVAVIDGRCGRKVNNALTMAFFDGTAKEPFATAVQGQADGVGGKLAILFGFRNGHSGKHVLTYLKGAAADGARVDVPTLDYGPTELQRDGHPLATILRENTPLDGKYHSSKDNAPVSGPSTATLPDGTVLFRFLPDPVEPTNDDRYRIQVVDAAGTPVASLDMVRTPSGWDAGEALLEFVLEGIDTSTGGSLPILVAGTRLVLYRETTQVERDVLLAACVELGISIRPYFTAMGTTTAWA